MKIEITDAELSKVIEDCVQTIACKEINELLSKERLNQMASERFNGMFSKECRKMIQDGKFYNSLAKNISTQMVDKITAEILPRINLNEITTLVAEKVAEKLTIRLFNAILYQAK